MTQESHSCTPLIRTLIRDAKERNLYYLEKLVFFPPLENDNISLACLE